MNDWLNDVHDDRNLNWYHYRGQSTKSISCWLSENSHADCKTSSLIFKQHYWSRNYIQIYHQIDWQQWKSHSLCWCCIHECLQVQIDYWISCCYIKWICHLNQSQAVNYCTINYWKQIHCISRCSKASNLALSPSLRNSKGRSIWKENNNYLQQ